MADPNPNLVHDEQRSGPAEKLTFTANDGPGIKSYGVAYHKVGITWAMQVEQDFDVETNTGKMSAHAGDYVCYDEKSGHVWSIPPSYVEQNYQKVGMGAVSADSMPTHVLYQALEALSAAARHLSATDVANAEVNLAEPRYRPLTQLCGEAAAHLQELLEETIGLATGANVGLGHDAQIQQLPMREKAREK